MMSKVKGQKGPNATMRTLSGKESMHLANFMLSCMKKHVARPIGSKVHKIIWVLVSMIVNGPK